MDALRTVLWYVGLPFRVLFVGGIRLYRATISGLLGQRCRFYPTCSAYAESAIRTHGFVKGTALALWRLLRCSPLTPGGVDHVPPRRNGAATTGTPSYDGVIRRRPKERRVGA